MRITILLELDAAAQRVFIKSYSYNQLQNASKDYIIHRIGA